MAQDTADRTALLTITKSVWHQRRNTTPFGYDDLALWRMQMISNIFKRVNRDTHRVCVSLAAWFCMGNAWRLFFPLVAVWVALFLVPGSCAWAGENLVVSFMISSGNQRTSWEQDVISRFRQAHPEVNVSEIVRDQEAYKSGFAKMLQARPIDVAFWFAGEKLRHAVRQDLLRPIDDAMLGDKIASSFSAAAVDAAAVRGHAYGLPLSYYGWGFYYRKSVFTDLGLTPPRQWSELLAVGRRLKAAGIEPTAVGAAEGWPAAAWFDYLNLRINGIDFHRKLLSGQARFTDPRVHEVMSYWQQLHEIGFFMPGMNDKSWDEPLPFLYRKLVGMVLMGGFASTKFPPQLVNDIGFFAFPAIAQNVAQFEDAPLDILVLPKNGANHNAAKKFLLFLSQSDVLNTYNNKVGQLSPLKSFQASGNNALELQTLQSAKSIAFYFDRDAKPQLIEPAFAAFKQFLLPPFDSDLLISTLDKASRR